MTLNSHYETKNRSAVLSEVVSLNFLVQLAAVLPEEPLLKLLIKERKTGICGKKDFLF